jgi:hypothetical protein
MHIAEKQSRVIPHQQFEPGFLPNGLFVGVQQATDYLQNRPQETKRF